MKPYKIWTEGRRISKIGKGHFLEVFIDNNSFKELNGGMNILRTEDFVTENPISFIKIPPQKLSSCTFVLKPIIAGTLKVTIEVSLDETTQHLNHELKVVNQDEVLVVYPGFLEPPIRGKKKDLSVVYQRWILTR